MDFQDFSVNLSTENHGEILLERLAEQRGTKLCDVSVYSSERRKYQCHKAVLAANSYYFLDLVQGTSKISTSIPSETLSLVLEYCYTGRVSVNENNCIGLLDASASLMVTSLEQIISNFIVRAAKANPQYFVDSQILPMVPSRLMNYSVGDTLIASSRSRRSALLHVFEGLARWAHVDHVTRWDVYLDLLNRANPCSTNVARRQNSSPTMSVSSSMPLLLTPQHEQQPGQQQQHQHPIPELSPIRSVPLQPQEDQPEGLSMECPKFSGVTSCKPED